MNVSSHSSAPSSSTGPRAEWLTADAPAQIVQLLADHGFWPAQELLQDVSRAGPGNMNLALRIRTNQRSLILKQARPWVEKYPSIAAPVNRHDHERRFYQIAEHNSSLGSRMPRLLGSIPAHHVLLLEDLGPAADWSTLYTAPAPWAPLQQVLIEILPWLHRLHGVPLSAAQRGELRNRDLRTLNHAHIFVVPYQVPPVISLDAITPGLSALVPPLQRHSVLQKRLHDLGEFYLSDGETLLHGDLFPGSWLNTAQGLRIIDPEFCFCGPAEFDWGILLAHSQLLLCGDAAREVLRPAGTANRPDIDWQLVEHFAAAEVLRRLLGVAQLPLTLDLATKTHLVDEAVSQLTT